MKRLLFILTLFCVFAFKCEDEIEFQDNQRLLLKGRILDAADSPIANIPVEVYATTDYDFNLNAALRKDYGDLIGVGTTDDLGNLSVIALSPLNASNIYAMINFNGSRAFKGGTAPLVLNFINAMGIKDNTYDVGNLLLDEIQSFELTTSRASNQTDTLQYNWTYKNSIKILGQSNIDPYFYDFDATKFGFNELLPKDETKTNTFNVIESDTILFDYRIINNGIKAEEQLEIIVNETTGSYVFEF